MQQVPKDKKQISNKKGFDEKDKNIKTITWRMKAKDWLLIEQSFKNKTNGRIKVVERLKD